MESNMYEISQADLMKVRTNSRGKTQASVVTGDIVEAEEMKKEDKEEQCPKFYTTLGIC